MEIPLTIVARNEEQAIGPCLESLLASARFVETRLPLRIAPLVVLDDCRDGTEEEVRRRGVPCLGSYGGKVEGQRRGQRSGPFQIFSDADILVSEEALHGLCALMLDEPGVQIAFPPKCPLPPRRRTPIAWALHVYNRRHGFSSRRSWFSGKLFAIRRWSMPTPAEVARRAEHLPRSKFYDHGAPLRVDDVLLSRQALTEGCVDAVRETAQGQLFYRAPETLHGMYRYYRRLRRELERTDLLFPETRPIHRKFGSRRPDSLDRTLGRASGVAALRGHAHWMSDRVRRRSGRLRAERLGGSGPVASRRGEQAVVIRLRPEGVLPLEVWDFPVDGRPLQAWRRTARFASALSAAVRQLRDDPPAHWSRAARERTAAIRHIHLTGGGAFESGVTQALLDVGFSTSVASDPRFAAARAGLNLVPRATCVDIGQTLIKLVTADDVTCVERDLVAAPHRDETTLDAMTAARASTIHFLGEVIARHAGARPLVLALPCEISDDGVVAGCTYCWRKQDAALLRELAAAAAVQWKELWVLNDAELAAAGARLDANVPAGQITLSLTLGFAVGAALLDKQR